MKRLYWRPKRVSRKALALLAMLSLLGMLAVEHFLEETRQSHFEDKRAAAERARECFEVIKQARLARGHAINVDLDPAESGMIGDLMTPVTSIAGDLPAKQTTVNPNFAAVVVDMLTRAGVERGDTVAIGYSGSFPALNVCVAAAVEQLGLKGIAISSATASQFGANLPDLLWIDMEGILHEKGFISTRSVASSIGGYDDLGIGITAETRDLISEALRRNKLSPIDATTFTGSIDQRMAEYRKHSAGAPVKVYINVGGGAASIGRSVGKRLYEPGLNLRPPRAALAVDSVMTRFAREGAAGIHLVQIRELAERYGLTVAPTRMPPIGEGHIFFSEGYNRALALGVLAAILTGLYAFALSDVGLRLLKGAARQTEPTFPQPAV